jgi:hypothetical protein
MNNNAENNHEMTVEEFVARLKKLKEKNEEKLAAEQDKLSEIEDAEPDSDGVRYERWQEKYDQQQLIVESYEETLDKINAYLAEYDKGEV